MDATEKERERLRRLAELYDRNDLSDDEYRREYERLASDSLESAPSANTASMPSIRELLEGGDYIPPPRTDLPRPRAESQPVEPRTPSHASPNQGMSGPAKDTFASGTMHRMVKPTIAMRRVRPKMNQLVYVPLVFLLGIGVALTIGMVKGGAVKKSPQIQANLSTSETPTTPTDQAPVSTTGSVTTSVQPTSSQTVIIQPQFGPDAVARCQSQCDRWAEQEKKVCQRGCKRRDLEMYGRRITLDDLNARAEADAIVQSCAAAHAAIPRAENENIWRASLEPFISAIQQVDSTQGAYQSKQLYQDLHSAQSKVRFPPEGNPESEAQTLQVLQAGCLIAHDALALWAFETVERQSDDFSATFYAQVRDELVQPKVQKVNAAKKDVAVLRGGSTL